MSLFARSFAGLSLTPGERALMKLIQGLAITAFGAVATTVAQLPANGTVDWSKTIAVAGVAAGVAVANALQKYFTAQGDAPLAAVAQQIGQTIAAQASVSVAAAGQSNDFGNKPDAPAPVA